MIPWFFCYKVKGWFGYDDALDTFGVHAIGGTIGAFLTGCLARNAVNGNLATNLKVQVTDHFFQPLVLEQLKAIGLTLVLAIVGTTVIAFIVKALLACGRVKKWKSPDLTLPITARRDTTKRVD